MAHMRRVRTMACVLVAITLTVTLLGGSTSAATADSRRKIVILDGPLTEEVTEEVVDLLEPLGGTVLYTLSLINALAVQLPPLPPPLPPLYLPVPDLALELLETLGEVYNDVLTFIDPICPTGVPVFEDLLEEYRWGMQQIGAPEAHMPWPPPSRQTGAVTVAVLDTGIAASHSELIGRTVEGYNAITDTPGQPSDDHGHGTHMAGIITAAKNGVGVVGVAGVEPKIKVAPVKVLDYKGGGYLSVVIKGLEWVLNDGFPRAALVNMSFGFVFPNPDAGMPLKKAIQSLSAADIIMVTSAGNRCTAGGATDDGGGDECRRPAPCNDPLNALTSPADYQEHKVIAVGATNSGGQIPDYSLLEPQLALVAPGGEWDTDAKDNGEILSTNIEPFFYGRGHGTSQAAAHVAGAVALALALDPGLTANAVRELLTETALMLPSGARRIDVENMIGSLAPIGE